MTREILLKEFPQLTARIPVLTAYLMVETGDAGGRDRLEKTFPDVREFLAEGTKEEMRRFLVALYRRGLEVLTGGDR